MIKPHKHRIKEDTMAAPKVVTVRVFAETLATIQWLTQQLGEKQPGLLKRLVDMEVKRVERAQTTRPDWNRL
jgi:hypothetical protein